jgi:hypothetical protein
MLALLTRSLGQRRPGAVRYVHRTPIGAQAAGRIHPLKICVTAAAVVNPRMRVDVTALVTAAGFDDVRVLAPGETGYYETVTRADAPLASSSDRVTS